ncbi:hypothetical protein AMJ57_01090 [Parcubacteria bacterium SG8_24]|nr:MAG: hypothetical protein AMJ57_01090 [Parcubacteria bacterium SG8_24]
MSEQKQIALEAPAHALQNVIANFDEEQFRLIMMSGGPARMYVLSPKHAKRIMLLLQKQIGDYEAQFGKVETELPQTVEGTATRGEVGFKVE